MRKTESSYIDITIPGNRPVRRLRGIRCHRADLAPQDVSVHKGIPCASVSRILLDLAARFSDETVATAANEAVVLEIFDMREMEDLLSRSGGHRGVRRLSRVLERGDLDGEDEPRSGLEERYAGLCRQHGLPKPAINRWLLLGTEYHQVDFLWRTERVVIEVDSKRYHRSGWKLRRDAHRDDLYAAHGFKSDRVPEALMKDDPLAAVSAAERLLNGQKARPRR